MPLRLSPPRNQSRVRGLEHAFTLAFSGCRCPPSALYTFPGVRRGAWLGVSSRRVWRRRAFTEFDGLHLGDFSPRAQVIDV